MPQTKITLNFGTAEQTFVLGMTNAPEAYDGFGTVTLYRVELGKELTRYVLIEERHETWHEMRYRSGLFTYEASDALDTNDIARRLYNAVLVGLPALCA